MDAPRKGLLAAGTAGLVVMAAAGAVAINLAAAAPTSPASYSGEAEPSGYPFPRNDAGQTYGSQMGATSSETTPDLISTYATNGELGYVLRVDLRDPDPPRNPQEAIASNNRPARTIPVYTVDGKTKIGVFVMKPAGQATAN